MSNYRRPSNDRSWVCPEHARFASSMERDYPRDDRGCRIPGKPKELKVDNRPEILIPEKKRHFLKNP